MIPVPLLPMIEAGSGADGTFDGRAGTIARSTPEGGRDGPEMQSLGQIASANLIRHQRLHRRMPERALGFKMLSPDLNLRPKPLRSIRSSQTIQRRLVSRHRCKPICPFASGV
jgi:hypothetical protein